MLSNLTNIKEFLNTNFYNDLSLSVYFGLFRFVSNVIFSHFELLKKKHFPLFMKKY